MFYRDIVRLGAATFVVFCTGCSGSGGPPPSQEDPRLLTIVAQSGGNWDRVSQADRAYLTQSLGKGNVMSARMAFQARATRNGRQGPPGIAPPPAP